LNIQLTKVALKTVLLFQSFSAFGSGLALDYIDAVQRVMEASQVVEATISAACKAQDSFYQEALQEKRITASQASALSDLYCQSARHSVVGWPKMKVLGPRMYQAAGVTIDELIWMEEFYKLLGYQNALTFLGRLSPSDLRGNDLDSITKESIASLIGSEDKVKIEHLKKLLVKPEAQELPLKRNRLLQLTATIGANVAQSRQRLFCSLVRQNKLGSLPANDANFATGNCS
jgi:hypothetical protein